MEKLNPKKLFEIFDKHPLNDLEENLISYKSSFKFKIEMFIKVVIYGDQWKKEVISLFDDSNADMDTNEIDRVGDFMLYTRAWYWLKQLDTTDEVCINSLKELNNPNLLVSIAKSINYFEKGEEFEKCAFLVKIKGFLK
jgi:hypothetical protein